MNSPRGLILSVFPGADLLGRGFELEGFCVVRGPDLVWGGDIKTFHPPRGVFAGVIGGPPCQPFSNINAKRDPEAGRGNLAEFLRVVHEAAPEWFAMENVPGVPPIAAVGYSVQGFFLNAAECGGRQHRNRFWQFGSRDGCPLVCDRRDTPEELEPACLASEGRRPSANSHGRKFERRAWGDFCELQGLPRDFDLPGLSVGAKFKAVGNGVPVPMARTIARAVIERHAWRGAALCACGCGRVVDGNKTRALPRCRKRIERLKTSERPVTMAEGSRLEFSHLGA